jgi:putative ABC transport system permease protein
MSLLHRIAGRFPSLVIARRNISRAKTRSALAALAVVIGVVTIGAIGGGSVAFKQSQIGLFEDAGANNVFVLSGTDARLNGDTTLDSEEIAEIQEVTGPRETVGTFSDFETETEFRKRPGSTTDVSATYIGDPRVLFDITSGSIGDNWRDSVVVSQAFADEHRLRPGDRITLLFTEEVDGEEVTRREAYRVSALYERPLSPSASDVLLPMTEAPTDEFRQLQIVASDTDEAVEIADRLEERFNDRRNQLLVFELSSLLRFVENLLGSINLLLITLGSISLVVAGVAIANTMLMAVIKRREEIGVLRAVGYQKGDVLRVLLVESAMLGAIGTFVGLALATLVTMLANTIFLDGPFAFTGEALLYLGAAGVFGVLISLLAGVYPAWRAANDRPVEALRG